MQIWSLLVELSRLVVLGYNSQNSPDSTPLEFWELWPRYINLHASSWKTVKEGRSRPSSLDEILFYYNLEKTFQISECSPCIGVQTWNASPAGIPRLVLMFSFKGIKMNTGQYSFWANDKEREVHLQDFIPIQILYLICLNLQLSSAYSIYTTIKACWLFF